MTHRRSTSRGLPDRARGVASVEFAIVLPLLVTILLGVWDFGRIVAANQVLSNAAREAGRQISTAQKNEADIKATVESYLKLAGIETSSLNVTVKNLTSSGRPNPQDAVQLDSYSVDVSLPTNNVRLILLNGLLGNATLRSKTIWMSMVDLPLSVPSTIPVN